MERLPLAATTHSSETIQEHELQGWSLLERFVRVLDEVGPGSREDHGLRTLERREVGGIAR